MIQPEKEGLAYVSQVLRLKLLSKNGLISAVFVTLFAVAFIVPSLVHGQVCGTDGYTQTGGDPYNGGSCSNNDGSGTGGSYSVTVTANPSTIQSGQSTLVSWSTPGYSDGDCTMDTMYTTNNNSWTNQTSPVSIAANSSKVDYPPYTTEYHVHCSVPYSYSQACGNTNCIVNTTIDRDGTADVNVTGSVPTLAASCSVSPTSITAGGSATWSASASGGTGTYAYTWSGTDGLSGSSQSVSKAYSVAGSKSGSVVVTSGTQSVTASCPNALTVTAAPPAGQPDLTVGGVTPTTATAGTAVTFTATATNIGQATSAVFPMIFQIRNVTTLSAGTLAALAPSASEPGSASYTFAAAGSYSVRACVDYSQTCVVAGTESDYSNNCGPWTTVTVATAVQPPLSCSVSNANPPLNQSVTYTASGASAPYTWTAADGGSYGTGATATRSFSAAGTYGMTVSKSGYTSATCPIVTAANAPQTCTNPTGTVTATPDRIQAGQTSTITFSASGINTSCTLSGPAIANQNVSANACTVPNNSVTTGPLTTQSTYILTCDGTERARAVVNVVPKFINF